MAEYQSAALFRCPTKVQSSPAVCVVLYEIFDRKKSNRGVYCAERLMLLPPTNKSKYSKGFGMALWLYITLTIAVVIIWRCRKLLIQIPSRKRRLGSTDRILVITAHPDDECMFFGPLIATAVTRWSSKVFILCCSTGSFGTMVGARFLIITS